MTTEFLLAAFREYGERTAIVFEDRASTYRWLADEIERLASTLDARLSPGTVVALTADYSPTSAALLLALLARGCVVAPLTPAFARQRDELFRIAEVEVQVDVTDERVSLHDVGYSPAHPILLGLRAEPAPGLVLFSSGSTGRSKAIVHHGPRLLDKYRTPRRPKVTIPFMLFDHIGGVNTLLHALSSGGTVVVAPDRAPETVCALVERHKVQVLPTSPTFVNLLLLSDHRRFDLSSLEILAYGAERMPPATLERLRAAFPGVELIQNYGLSEVGIMHTKSESSGSLWMKIGGALTRVRDGLLEIKASSAMLGYLNEESPFTEDGWFKTGDRVEVNGEYVKILGRESDLLIVGGEKVYPAEVEDLLMTLDGVIEAVVGGEPNAISGTVVRADVRLATDETRAEFRARMLAALGERVPSFKLPQRISVTKEPLHNARFKKVRSKA